MSASENDIGDAISSGQVRAARSFIAWTRAQLSAASGVPIRTIARFEDGEGTARDRARTAIRTALEAAGVEFIAENEDGAGVRLKRPQS